MWFRVLPWLPNYARAFGPLTGARFAARAKRWFGTGGNEAKPLSVPGMARPVWLRPDRGDIAILHQIWVQHAYAMDDMRQVEGLRAAHRAMLDAGRRPLLLDGGSHVGLATLWFRSAWPDLAVIAVEPDDENLATLRRNVGDLPGVEIVQAGLWDRSTALGVVDRAEFGAAVRLHETADGPLHALSIDALLARRPDADPLIVKLDVEGAERAIFRSNLDWMDRVHLLIVEVHDWLFPGEASSRELLRALADRRFDCLLRGENLFCFRLP